MKLKELGETGVIVNTENELVEYLQICEDGGWLWTNGDEPLDYKGTNDIRARIPCYIGTNRKFGTGTIQGSTIRLITLEQFKKEQGIMKYKEGDVLVNRVGRTQTIQGNIGTVYLTTDSDEDSYTYTETELHGARYTLKTDEPKLTEVTLEQVAEKMGVPVDQLRIKD